MVNVLFAWSGFMYWLERWKEAYLGFAWSCSSSSHVMLQRRGLHWENFLVLLLSDLYFFSPFIFSSGIFRAVGKSTNLLSPLAYLYSNSQIAIYYKLLRGVFCTFFFHQSPWIVMRSEAKHVSCLVFAWRSLCKLKSQRSLFLLLFCCSTFFQLILCDRSFCVCRSCNA